jgi:Asp-tRNA(Asn)/Glu-tRNA(Gln) amidotransferase A subunit family amidase
LTSRDYGAAAGKRLETYEHFRALFERFDVLLTPTGPVKPFPIEQNYPDRINGVALEKYTDWFASNSLVTLVSLPAASAPAGLTADGLPVGMQIVAPRFEEPLILRVARAIHRSSNVGWPPLAA